MKTIRAGQILSYAALPGIIPRMRILFASGFGTIAFLMAQVYGLVRLLPPAHPYLRLENRGRFGLRHVIAEAANHLVLSRKNLDQILIFFALLAGVVLLFAQFALLIYGFVLRPALAQGMGGAGANESIFITQNPEFDIALMMMDEVFGIPEMFGSCVSTDAVCTHEGGGAGQPEFPYPFHHALHDLLQFYSTVMLLVGVLIFLYFIVVVVAETAKTGSPFGQRFQNIWVPVRLVIALGLLLPLGYGLNGAQYTVLYAAKYGSAFATNGWIRFNQTIANHDTFADGGANPTGEKTSLLALPNEPDISPVVHFMSLAKACAYGYWRTDGMSKTAGYDIPPGDQFYIRPYFVKNIYPWMNLDDDPKDDKDSAQFAIKPETTYAQALNFYDNNDIVIRFGREDYRKTAKFSGGVVPLCGEIRIPINSLKNKGEEDQKGGAGYMQKAYFEMVRDMWFSTGEPNRKLWALSHRYMEKGIVSSAAVNRCVTEAGADDMGCGYNMPSCTAADGNAFNTPCAKEDPGADFKLEIIKDYQVQLNQKIADAWNLFRNNSIDAEMQEEILRRGWGGAGIWYNAIADINGTFVTAVLAMPEGAAMPLVMEKVQEKKQQQDNEIKPEDRFMPNMADGRPVELNDADIDLEQQAAFNLAARLNDLHSKFWGQEENAVNGPEKSQTGNVMQNIVNMIFGTDGLFEMRGKNAGIHPLAQLAALGKGLVDHTLRNLALTTGLAFMGGVMKTMPILPTLASALSSFLSTTTFIGIIAGVTLYYILPFLPFIYFFFAVMEWVKTVFEAMVGAPLWALAHLRIDGEGMSGDAASQGYFLIFDIFLRPIVSIFGLIAGIIIFTAQVRVLNFIWDMVTDNVSGFGDSPVTTFQQPADTIDQFFFTIFYAIIVYLLATSSFKLINMIPDGIMRWGGSGVSSFGKINPDELQNQLTGYVATAGIVHGTTLTNSIRNVAGQAGGMLGDMLPKPNSNQTSFGPPSS
ncbi:MAG: DotA/TraY family protein [Alphaproteobacteria bacterium]|nr:DotA/TraY family protein [Alphaproteobacteria bacterium]